MFEMQVVHLFPGALYLGCFSGPIGYLCMLFDANLFTLISFYLHWELWCTAVPVKDPDYQSNTILQGVKEMPDGIYCTQGSVKQAYSSLRLLLMKWLHPGFDWKLRFFNQLCHQHDRQRMLLEQDGEWLLKRSSLHWQANKPNPSCYQCNRLYDARLWALSDVCTIMIVSQ